jgi:nitrite reductase/ring-hydroxylating ferredoxin subunit
MPGFIVGPVDELPPGTKRRVEVDLVIRGSRVRRVIAVFNVDGTFYALRDVCPHQGAPLSSGIILGQLRATGPGEYEFDGECKKVRCPWHGWEYDLSTGQSWYDPEHDRVRAYPVAVQSGEQLAAPAEGEAAGSTGQLPGPYVAETFPVSVEDNYVVIQL